MQTRQVIVITVALTFMLALRSAGHSTPSITLLESYNVVIYGGTSAGVSAAIRVARMGNSVILIEPGQHLGGMTASGLGHTDVGNQSSIGGFAREFYQRVYSYYHGGDLDNPGQWQFEPHVAEEIFNNLISEENIPVLYGERLDPDAGLEMANNRIVAIKMESGLRISGLMFIDATYEGDLMALAGVTYTSGREGNDRYGESIDGVQTSRSTSHNFNFHVDPYFVPGDPSSGLLPGIQGFDPGIEGSGDNKIQAYNFRMCLTNVPENRLPWEEPDDYDPLRYELLLRYFDAGFDTIPLDISWQGIPNGKSDTNNNHAFSTDNIGMNYCYPDGDYETRSEIIRDHEIYQRGLMWTLATNPRVPEHIRATLSEWGLARDEFTDNNNWPFQLYIRESRRMVSDYVMTDRNCLGDLSATDPVGMGSYSMDSHNVQRYVNENGFVQNEGNIWVGGFSPYPVSYRSIIPPIGECENLLVPVCVSATHAAYGSIRMEPVYIILGESAGTASVISIDTATSVQDLFYPILREVLTKYGQILTMAVDPVDLGWFVVDDTEASFTGEWIESQSVLPYVGSGYVHDDNTQSGKSIRFNTDLPSDGDYEVRFFYTPHENRATNVSINIYHADGISTITVNENLVPPINRMSISLGVFHFLPSGQATVEVINDNANGYVIADAVQFIRIPAH
jgi:hypothetical protein